MTSLSLKSRDFGTFFSTLLKTEESIIVENCLSWTQSSIAGLVESRNPTQQRLAALSALVLLESHVNPGLVTALVDGLLGSQLEPEFVVKVISRLAVCYQLQNRQKPIQTFLAQNSIRNTFSALLLTKIYEKNSFFIKTLQTIEKTLQSLPDEESVLNEISFHGLCLSILIASSGPLSLPVESTLSTCLSLLRPIGSPKVNRELRKTSAMILESLLVSLGNDLIVFSPKIIESIVETIDEPMVPIVSRLSPHMTEQQSSRVVNRICAKITNEKDFQICLKILRIISANKHRISSTDWSKAEQTVVEILLQYWKSRKPHILNDWRIRKELIEVCFIFASNPIFFSILRLVSVREENHEIREFCRNTFGLLNRGIPVYRLEDDINHVISDSDNVSPEPPIPVPSSQENQMNVSEEPIETEEPMIIFESQPKVISDSQPMVISEESKDNEVDDILNDFVV